MPVQDRDVTDAVVICTRNRPGELEQTLTSIATHPPVVNLMLTVIDASDEPERARNRTLVEAFQTLPTLYRPYTDVPSLAAQRNHAVDTLPSSVDVVHFIDDDVTVQARYFDVLSDVLRSHSDVGGVGGVIVEPGNQDSSAGHERLRRLFCLSHSERGRVLPSGCTTTAQHPDAAENGSLRASEWLSGCSSSYRRPLLERHRFDEALTGYAMLEDLDLSYRIGRRSRLVVHPEARLRHRRAGRNRPDAERYAHALTVHRRWFVEKHLGNIGSRGAYWWSIAGRLLAVTASSAPHRTAALRGLLRGIRTVWTRNHPLLGRRS